MDVDGIAESLADAQHGVVARWQLVAAGAPLRAIDARVECGRWKIKHEGVYRLPGTGASFLQNLSSARLAGGPRAVAGGQGAAGLWRIAAISPMPEILVPHAVLWRVEGVDLHRTRSLPDEDVCIEQGIPTTTIPRTVMDLSARFRVGRIAIAMDDLLSSGRVTWSDLHRQLERRARRGVPGVRVYRALLMERAGEKRPWNRFERRLHRVLTSHGQPAPVMQFEIELPDGRRRYVDAAYPDEMVYLECVSYRYHSGLEPWSRDQSRAAELSALGWIPIPVTWWDLDNRPEWIAQVTRDARASRFARSGHLSSV